MWWDQSGYDWPLFAWARFHYFCKSRLKAFGPDLGDPVYRKLAGSRGRRPQELILEGSSRHRPAEEIALPFLASHAHQQIGRGAVLDTFGDHRQAELLAEAD